MTVQTLLQRVEISERESGLLIQEERDLPRLAGALGVEGTAMRNEPNPIEPSPLIGGRHGGCKVRSTMNPPFSDTASIDVSRVAESLRKHAGCDEKADSPGRGLTAPAGLSCQNA
jgi:hypothetical protein